MNPKIGDKSERDRQLDEVVTAYLKDIDAGRAPNPPEWLARHPDLADDLAVFLAAQDQVDHLAAPLRAPHALTDPVPVRRISGRLEGATTEAVTLAPGEAVPPDRALGTVRYFGDYELIEEIGRGGMGVVYKARQASLNRTVALKMILAGQLANDTDVRRFHAEAEAAAKLDHPGIVPVYEVGRHEQQHYFSMAFVEGESLAHKIVERLVSPRKAAELTRKVAEAVAYAHVEGVIHRDLKPANILIDRNGQPRLTDFGLAKRMQNEPGDVTADGLTATGQILGTPSYMPPEQAGGQGGTVGPLSDVYSLGAVLYCLLTGRPPFQSDNPLDTLLQVVQQEPVAPRQLNAAVPRDLETICLKCLAKEPRKRYPSAQELVADLDRYLTGRPILARPVSAAGRAWRWCRRNPALAASSALAGTALLVTVVLAVVFAIVQFRAADHNRMMLAESYFDRGQALCEQGDVARGMLWFARSLETAPGNATDLQQAIRANLGAWHVPGPRLRKVLTGVSNVTAVAMAADGKTLMTARQNELRLWDVATGAPIGEPLLPKAYQHTESFSPDGKLFAVGGMDPSSDVTAVIWDTATRKPIQSLRLRPVDFNKVGFNPNAQKTAFSPNSKVLVTTNYSSVQLWDVATGRPIGPTFRHSDGDPILHKEWIEALALSPDGKVLATGSRDSTVRLWDATTGLPLGDPLPHDAWVRSVAFSPDGKTLVSGALGGTAKHWEVATGKLIGAPIIHRGYIYAVAFSSNGRLIMTAAGDVMRQDGENSARLWDAVTHKPMGMAMNHRDWVEAVAFSPDGKSVVTSGGDDVCVWDLPEHQPAETTLTHGGPLVSVAFSPDGSVFVTACDLSKALEFKGEVRFWQAKTGRPVGEAVPIAKFLRRAVFSPDGTVLAAVIDADYKPTPGKQGVSEPAWEVRLIDVATHRPIGQPLELWGQIGQVSFSTDSTTVITEDFSQRFNDRDGMIRTWDIATSKLLDERKKPDLGVIVDPEFRRVDGKRIRMGGGGDNILVFTDVATNKVAGLIQSPGGIGPTAISPDGALLVTAGGRAQQLWDLAAHKPIGPPLDPVAAVAFSPDGQTILSGGRDGNARLRSLPPIALGKVDRIVLWVEVLSGSVLDRNYPARGILRPQHLWSRVQQLEKLGGPPLP